MVTNSDKATTRAAGILTGLRANEIYPTHFAFRDRPVFRSGAAVHKPPVWRNRCTGRYEESNGRIHSSQCWERGILHEGEGPGNSALALCVRRRIQSPAGIERDSLPRTLGEPAR